MKKIIVAFILVTLSLNSFSQTCEERESKILSLVGGFSAGMLYNTYGVIGAIADGFTKDAYTQESVNSLMSAQKSMADNFIKMLEENVKQNVFIKESDKNFIVATIEIIKGLKKQAQLLIDISETNSGKKKDAYEDQRKKNWAELSKLMGIEE
jgi:hypothetical protein